MTKTLVRMGDRLLGRFVPATTAGACVPEHGQRCACVYIYKQGCCSSKQKYVVGYVRYFACNGTCSSNSQTICTYCSYDSTC